MARNVRLGMFVLVTFAIFVLFVFLVGSQESKFEANDHIQAQFQNVSGLEEGADVRVGGLREGAVRKIVLPAQPDGKMSVVMDVSRHTRKLIRQDSVASIKSEGLVGNKYVEISFGTASSPPVPNGGSIGSAPPIDISDVTAKADKILESAKGAFDNLQGATENVNAISAKVNSGRGTAGQLINNPAMYKEATASVEALHADADALKHNFLLRGFFNKNGFADPGEIQKDLIAQLPPEEPQKTFVFDTGKVFDKPASAKLKDGAKLKEAGAFLESQHPDLTVIEASAGPIGEAEADRTLTQSQAYAVRAYLLEHFKLEDKSLRIIGLGKTDTGPGLRILVYRSGSDTAHE